MKILEQTLQFGAQSLFKNQKLSKMPTLPTLEKEIHGDFKRQQEVSDGYLNRSIISPEERIRLMYRKDAFGNLSPELDQCAQSTSMAVFAGAIAGFGLKSREVYFKFVEDNKHEMFKSPKDAQILLRRELFQHSSMAMLKTSTLLGAGVGVYTISTQTYNTYTNEVSLLGHLGLGFILGSLYRIGKGPRAALGAGALGASLSLFDGLVKKATVYLNYGSYEAMMLDRYETMCAENAVQAGENFERSKTVRDTWIQRDQDGSNAVLEDTNVFSRSTRAIVDAIRSFVQR